MTTPDLRVHDDGTGCASFCAEDFLELATAGIRSEVETKLGVAVELVGVRYVDADGRDTELAVTGGHALVGFRTTLPPLPR